MTFFRKIVTKRALLYVLYFALGYALGAGAAKSLRYLEARPSIVSPAR